MKIGELQRFSVKRSKREIGSGLALQLASAALLQCLGVARLLNAEHQHQRNDDRHNNQNDRIAFHKTPLQNEPVQQRKITREQGEFSQDQEHAESHEQAAARDFHRVHVTAEAAVKLHKTFDAKRR